MKTAITTRQDFMNKTLDGLVRETYVNKTKDEIISFIANKIETIAMIRIYGDVEIWENYDNNDAYECAVEIYDYMKNDLGWF